MRKVNCFWLGHIYLQIYWYNLNSKVTVLSYYDFLFLLLSIRKIRYLGLPFQKTVPFKIDGLCHHGSYWRWHLKPAFPEPEVMINSPHASSVWCGIFGMPAMCCSELKLVLPSFQGEKILLSLFDSVNSSYPSGTFLAKNQGGLTEAEPHQGHCSALQRDERQSASSRPGLGCVQSKTFYSLPPCGAESLLTGNRKRKQGFISEFLNWDSTLKI